MNPERYQGYGNHGQAFKEITEQYTGLPVPESLILTWQSFSRATRVLDFYLDSTSGPDDRNRLANIILTFAHPQSNEQTFISSDKYFNELMEDFRDHLRQCPPERQESFFRALKQTLSVTEQIKQAKNVDELARLTRLEGQLTIRMIVNLLPEGFRQNQNFKRYLRLMTRLGRLANTSDTLIDMEDDSRAGEITIIPSLRNKWRMLKQIIPDAVDVARYLSPTLVKAIVFSVVYQLRRKNSSREPLQSYSTSEVKRYFERSEKQGSAAGRFLLTPRKKLFFLHSVS